MRLAENTILITGAALASVAGSLKLSTVWETASSLPAETMSLLRREPGLPEITVERARSLRFASGKGHFHEVFHSYNQPAG